jgi:CheY-like chemotaxis protein
MPGPPRRIVLVESNIGDVRLFETALAALPSRYILQVLEDGEQAIDFLLRRKTHADAPRPDLIFLTNWLCRRTAIDVLRMVKSDMLVKHVPVVILASSGTTDDELLNYYRAHVNCFVQKPKEVEEYVEVVKSLIVFWGQEIRLPRRL